MSASFSYTVLGRPTTWKRPAQARGWRGRHGGRYTEGSQRHAQRAHALHALEARPVGWRRDGRFMVRVWLDMPDARRSDVDNAVKLILDALNGIAWEDDSQIDALEVDRAMCGDAGPRTVVEVVRTGERMRRRAA